eukprot:6177513-Pleurochrysis_carterae.AAC.7
MHKGETRPKGGRTRRVRGRWSTKTEIGSRELFAAICCYLICYSIGRWSRRRKRTERFSHCKLTCSLRTCACMFSEATFRRHPMVGQRALPARLRHRKENRVMRPKKANWSRRLYQHICVHSLPKLDPAPLCVKAKAKRDDIQPHCSIVPHDARKTTCGVRFVSASINQHGLYLCRPTSGEKALLSATSLATPQSASPNCLQPPCRKRDTAGNGTPHPLTKVPS